MKRSYYLLAFTIPLSISLSFYFQGVWSYLAIFYAFAFLPALELVLPIMPTNLSGDHEDRWKSSVYFDLILWLMVPIQYGLLIYFCQLMGSHQLELFERIGLITAMGLGCGVIGINVAHELGHRNNMAEQSMAKLLLSTSLYWHFFIEHNKGHHKNVSTPLDPESSHLNETLYAFWYRSIKDSFLSAYRIDASEMVKALLLQLLLLILIFALWGKFALICFVASAIIGIILLESVNYIEHYGLSRKEISPLRYEKVRVIHSWNADNPLSRAVLFDLSRHSDHHAHANRKYQ
jgi:alkane 1-monooxygenase